MDSENSAYFWPVYNAKCIKFHPSDWLIGNVYTSQIEHKTNTSLNIIKHVKSSFENPYTVQRCFDKATEEL